MKIMVSACLAGENCKYNGGNNRSEKVLKLMAENEVLTVCPEQMGGLPTPRVPSEICNGVVTAKDGVTAQLLMENGFRCVDVEDLVEVHNDVLIRKLSSGEICLLKDFLYEAIFIPEGLEPPPRDIVERPELRIYYEYFGRSEADLCLVAEADGHVVGAVWTRIMNDYGHVDDETPSFAISLIPEYRGKGIGTRLMRNILSLLKEQGFKQAACIKMSALRS